MTTFRELLLTYRQAEFFKGRFHQIRVLEKNIFQIPTSFLNIPQY